MPKFEPHELSAEDIISIAMDIAWDACREAATNEDGLPVRTEKRLADLEQYLTGALSDNSSLGPATADQPVDAPETA